MPTNVVVRARIDQDVKDEAAVVLASMGLTISDAFRLMMIRVVREKALPFAPPLPTEAILEGIKEARGARVDKNQILLNLACAGVNELVDRELVDLNSLDDSEGRLDTPLFEKPSRVSWRGLSHGELEITIWWNVKPGCGDENTRKPLTKQISRAVDACCTIWLERKNGKWIQTRDNGVLAKSDTYLSRAAQNHLSRQPEVSPNGYAKEGKFFL